MCIRDSSNLDSQIATSRRKLTTLQDSIRRDAAQFERDRAALFTADGKQLYNTDIHAEKMSALVERATSAAQATIVQIVTEQEHLATLQQAARAESLSLMGYSAEELQRATALRPFIEADVATLDARNLTANVHAAVHGGDRVALPGAVTSLPSIHTDPVVGSSSPATMRRVVDLPQPDGPIITTSSPEGNVRSRRSIVARPPLAPSYRLLMPVSRTSHMTQPR